MTPPSPFRRISREVLVENAWHRYCRDRFTQTDGSEGVYHYVDMPGSCGIVPLFDDGSTVLVHCDRYLLGTTLWEFPIGGMKDGEDPLAVARKELAEEAGLVAKRWDRLGVFAPYKGVSNERCHFFLARELSWTAQHLEPSEAMTVHRLPLAEAKERLLGQELPDGQSLCGLVLLERFLAAPGAT
ncbi:MAG: NUDIX hydrolase [Planctomycetes bacterium]|nr:NUDIX hydrolase [Planctomycetota bacterium]